MPISKWGEQTVYIGPQLGTVTTPPMQAIKMLTEFGRSGSLVPKTLAVPEGVHYLCCRGARTDIYYVVNSTSLTVTLPVSKVVRRRSLFAPSVLATSILKYGSYGDAPGDVREILPREFKDGVLPPYSVSVIDVAR
jgi:hypothetical protein